MSQFRRRNVLVGLVILNLICSETVVCDETCEGGSVKEGKPWQCVNTEAPHNTSTSIRVKAISQGANSNYPILFVIKQQKSVLSWALPYVIQSTYNYNEVSHTLCPEDGLTSSTAHNITIDVTTSSKKPVDFTLEITTVENFELRTSVPRTFVVSPSNPKYYVYTFPEDVDVMLVKAMSPSNGCALMSIQRAKCPVYDQHRNVEFEGQFQTMTKQAAITVQKSTYPTGQFFVVVVVLPSDHMCLGTPLSFIPIKNTTSKLMAQVETNRSKSITVTVVTILPVGEYWKPIITTVAVLLSLYLLTGCIMLVHHRRAAKQSDWNLEEQVHILAEDSSASEPFSPRQGTTADMMYGTTGPVSTNSDGRDHSLQPASDIDDDSGDEDIDMLEDIHEEKEIYRTKTGICVADLSRKKPKTLDRKYKLYYWNLLTVAVFYSLPVIQLVITYQAVLNMSGNEDMCYYNFLCAMPVGPISAFNNVFSNIGYVMLGFLYLLIVWRKDYIHKQAVASGSQKAKMRGIPKHFGLFYSLGIALVMEGVLSGSYHVCPNYSNFQFDTSFMYMIAGLGMLVLYQQRHPDVNANAYAAFAAFAAVIFIALMGVVFVSVYFYVIFALLHVTTCLAVSAQIYYMGTWKLDLGMFKRAFNILRTVKLRNCAKPVYVDRMIVLVLGNAVNWSIMIYGLATMPKDFNSFLLTIFLVNLLLYVAFYTIMKLRSGERLIAPVILVVLLSLLVWGSALYFYFMALTGWEKTPSLSRDQNAPCLLMNFYDGHDVWHILSSGALFLSFLLVLFLDEDLQDKERSKIPVF